MTGCACIANIMEARHAPEAWGSMQLLSAVECQQSVLRHKSMMIEHANLSLCNGLRGASPAEGQIWQSFCQHARETGGRRPEVPSMQQQMRVRTVLSQEAVDDADVAAATAALFSYLERELR